MNRSRLFTFVGLFSSLAFALVALGVGCAAPAAEDDVDDGSGAMTVGASLVAKIEPGYYAASAKDDGTKPWVGITSDSTVLSASIRWKQGLYDRGDLDVKLSDRSKGTNDESGNDGDGGTRCGFTIKALEKNIIQATSHCGRGDLKLARLPD